MLFKMSLKNNMSLQNKSQLSLSSMDSLTELSPEGNGDTSMSGRMTDDWANRQFIETLSTGIQKITNFLNNFDKTCKAKLATLNQRLTAMEKSVSYLETYSSNPTSIDTLRESQKLQQQDNGIM